MKHKQTYFLRGSVALVLFMILGYTVKFYPNNLTLFDSSIQTAVRGNLPQQATTIFRAITFFGNTMTLVFVLLLAVLYLYRIKRWKMEALFLGLNGAVSGLLIVVAKSLYARARPSIEHLVFAQGFSFPSGHSVASMMVYGFVAIIVHQRLASKSLRLLVEGLLALLIVLIGLSRIYLGVHYPTDVLAGFLLGLAFLYISYPFYDQKRFEARFQGKQK